MNSIEYHYPTAGSRCKKHPKYKVMRKPQSGCSHCWAVWLERELVVTFGSAGFKAAILAIDNGWVEIYE